MRQRQLKNYAKRRKLTKCHFLSVRVVDEAVKIVVLDVFPCHLVNLDRDDFRYARRHQAYAVVDIRIVLHVLDGTAGVVHDVVSVQFIAYGSD